MEQEYVAIVGSREASLDDLELLIRIGRTYTDLGVAVSSGDAFGSDRAGWYGAKQSRKYSEVGARIYLVDSKASRKRVAQQPFFMVAQDFSENWDLARAMAQSARGSFRGLDDYGEALHTRNVFQIFGHDLKSHVRAIIYSAPTVGDIKRECIKGGTATALHLAIEAGVPIRKNLFTEAGTKWAIEFLKHYEQDYPYEDIDWRQILRPTDPRLEHLC